MLEKYTRMLFSLDRQSDLKECIAHQLHPAVAGSLVDLEWQMSRSQAGMPALFDISLRTTEPIN
jgi:hypothetical protein